MKRLPDISEYYKGPLAEAEEKAWREVKEYERNLSAVLRARELFAIHGILELGCGTGWIPQGLPLDVIYVGVDNNPEFLSLARAKNPRRTFLREDLRKVTRGWLELQDRAHVDAVCCFAVLKHFGLHEWDDIFSRLLGLGNHAIFDVQITPHDVDDGKEFHHVSVTRERVHRKIGAAGHRIYEDQLVFDGKLGDGVTPMQVHIFITGR